MEQDLLQTFEVKEQLNPGIWENVKSNDFTQISLDDEVSKNLIEIADMFLESLKLPKGNLQVHDIVITGSMSNYNWSIYSDIDLHILLDKSAIDENTALVDEFLQSKKTIFNNQYDFKIKGHVVEIYPQDVNEYHEATGVYSVLYNEWVETPNRDYFSVNKNKIEEKAMDFIEKIEDIEQEFYNNPNYSELLERINKLKDQVKNYRKAGLEKGGESSVENLVFKYLRRVGYLYKLSQLKIKVKNNMLSIDEAINF